MRNAIVYLALALFLAACAAPATPTPTSVSVGIPVPSLSPSDTPEPTLPPSPSATVTLAPPTGSPTIQPSNTAISLPSFTPFIFTLASITPTGPASSELQCRVISQSIADGTEFKPGERFSVNWKVRNTGSATWFPGSMVWSYIGGTKMHLYSPESLTLTVPPGEETGLSVDMRAPKGSTYYTTSWGLVRGTQAACVVRVTILVETLPTPTPP